MANNFLNFHHRHSIRLPGADYSVPGFYFVTICTKNREHLFGEIKDAEMVLNEFGKIVQEEWEKSQQIRKEIILDQFQIMPNHVHGIVLIVDKNNGQTSGVGARGLSPLPPCGERPFRMQPRSISSFIVGFKSAVTIRINHLREFRNTSVWQRNYFEHIIRNDASLNRIRQYIQGNPFNWQTDLENNKFKNILTDKEREKQTRIHYTNLFI